MHSASFLWLLANFANNIYHMVYSEKRPWFGQPFVASSANSLWPVHSTWRHKTCGAMIQVTSGLLSSHYPKQWYLIISETLWRSPEGNFTGSGLGYLFLRQVWNYQFTAASPRASELSHSFFCRCASTIPIDKTIWGYGCTSMSKTFTCRL